MPDGPLCWACHGEAVRHRGSCARCGRLRLLPGVDGSTGERLCCDCAGIKNTYTCRRCTTEWTLRRGLCEWCRFGDVLDVIMEGDVDLSALRSRLLGVSRPDSILNWLVRAEVRELLADLSTGTVTLTHAGLDGFRIRRIAEHTRGLLVAAGLLPKRDEYLAHFDRWVGERLSEHAGSAEDLTVLETYAAWELRRRLVISSEAQALGPDQIARATQCLRMAATLLTWLHVERGHSLAECTQADLDCWLVGGTGSRVMAHNFTRWAIKTQRCSKLMVSKRAARSVQPLDHAGRLHHLEGLLDPKTGGLADRVAGVLVVLFGQPFTRIATLGVDDILVKEGAVGIRLGRDIAPVPPPFADMFAQLVADPPNRSTATNPTSPWLFPGRLAGSHLTAGLLRGKVRAMGISNLGARSGALRQLVLDCPPTVVADMLGYTYNAIEHHAQHAGSPWASYAALRQIQPSDTPDKAAPAPRGLR